MNEKVYDDFEDELDAIRLSLYNEVKDMTTDEIGRASCRERV